MEQARDGDFLSVIVSLMRTTLSVNPVFVSSEKAQKSSKTGIVQEFCRKLSLSDIEIFVGI